MEIVKGNTDNFKKEVLESKVPVLVDFNATWCGPCRMLGPVLEELASEREDVKVVSIDVDENESLASQYRVFSIPCLVLIKDGEEAKREVGFKTKEELNEFIGE